MKKFLAIIVLSLLWCKAGFAESLADGLFDIACQFGVKVNNPAKGSLKGIEG